jgi:hypothetical protein
MSQVVWDLESGNLLIVNKAIKRRSWIIDSGAYSSFIKSQISQFLPIRGEPKRIVRAIDFFFINPVRDSIEDILSTIFCDLSRTSVLPNV